MHQNYHVNQQRDETIDKNIESEHVSTTLDYPKRMMTHGSKIASKEPDSQAKVLTSIMPKPSSETSTSLTMEKTHPKQVDQVRATTTTTTMVSNPSKKSTKQTPQTNKVQVVEFAIAATSSKTISGNNSQTEKSQQHDQEQTTTNIKEADVSKNYPTRIDNPSVKVVASKDKALMKNAESDHSTILLPRNSTNFNTTIASEKSNPRSLPLKTLIKMKASAQQKISEVSSDDDSKVEGNSLQSRALLMDDLKNDTTETVKPSVEISNDINRSNWKRIKNLKKERHSINQSNWKRIERLMMKQRNGRVALS